MFRLMVFIAAIITAQSIEAQTRTVGLLNFPAHHEPAYYLFSPLSSKTTALIDECGDAIRIWNSQYSSGASQILLEDGSLLRCGFYLPPHFGPGSGGIIEKFDWDGNITWKFILGDSSITMHHDIDVMPNGNILAIAWELKTKQEATLYGRDPNLASPNVWNEKIIEIKPLPNDDFEIVWEWSAWDHVIQNYDSGKPNYGDPSLHPELLNLNYVGKDPQDWLHMNSINYNSKLDQILLSAHSTDEILIIDHSTTTAQAKGHNGGKYGKGGDLLYRWGNPEAYDRGTSTDKTLYQQHHAHWIPDGQKYAGKILIFNNGMNRPGAKYSTIDLIDPPANSSGFYISDITEPFGPAASTILFKTDQPTEFYAMNLSSVYMMDSGLFINSGPQGTFFETNTSGDIVWKYVNPLNGYGALKQSSPPVGNAVFRCQRYLPTYKGFSGKTLTSTVPLESDPIEPSLCSQASIQSATTIPNIKIYPNPAHTQITVSPFENCHGCIYNIAGKLICKIPPDGIIDISSFPNGLYSLSIERYGEIQNSVFVKN